MTITRNWRANDTVELRMPFGFELDHVMDQPNVASIFYGPVLLAAEESASRSDWRQVTLDASDLGKSITGDQASLRFTIDGTTLKPFHESYGRHSVYNTRDAQVREFARRRRIHISSAAPRPTPGKMTLRRPLAMRLRLGFFDSR